jgi:hypothetical protein
MTSPSPLENRQPAPLPQTSRGKGRIGWLVAFAMGLFAALLVCRNFELTTTVRIMQNEAELAQIAEQSLKQQIDAERILATRQIADLTAQSAKEPFTFVNLVAPQSSETKASATIVWQQSTQEGAFITNQLPAPAPDEEYRLWLEDTAGHSVSAGIINGAPSGPTQILFKAEQRLKNATRITLTCEHKGAVTQPSGPILLTGLP